MLTEERRAFNEDKRVSVEFGYITSVLTGEEDAYYIAYVLKERCIGSSEADPALLILGHPQEELVSLYGSPEDLIGRRVRVEHFGSDWTRGIAYLCQSGEFQNVGTSMEVPSSGFRHAVAGGGSI